MKRTIIVLLLISMLCVVAGGCSDETLLVQEENMEEPYPVDVEKTSTLLEDDYYIYENEKAVMALSDYNESSIFFSNLSIYNEDHEKVIDFEDREITTKRGIKIGSTIREFASAYEYSEIQLVDQDLVTTANEFLANMNSYDLGDKYIITISTYCTLDGQTLCRTEWEQYAHDNGIDLKDYVLNPSKYCEKAFRIDFIVEDNMISNILLTDSIIHEKNRPTNQ